MKRYVLESFFISFVGYLIMPFECKFTYIEVPFSAYLRTTDVTCTPFSYPVDALISFLSILMLFPIQVFTYYATQLSCSWYPFDENPKAQGGVHCETVRWIVRVSSGAGLHLVFFSPVFSPFSFACFLPLPPIPHAFSRRKNSKSLTPSSHTSALDPFPALCLAIHHVHRGRRCPLNLLMGTSAEAPRAPSFPPCGIQPLEGGMLRNILLLR